MRIGLRQIACIILLLATFRTVTLLSQQFQRDAASKTAMFGSVSKTDASWQKAFDAHDLAAGLKLIGQTGAFKGTVSKVYESRDGDLVILDFDPNYRTALTAILKRPDFGKFPDVRMLEGKEVLVSGKFVDYQGKAEIELNESGQIRLAH
jgi:hypothetical protein